MVAPPKAVTLLTANSWPVVGLTTRPIPPNLLHSHGADPAGTNVLQLTDRTWSGFSSCAPQSK